MNESQLKKGNTFKRLLITASTAFIGGILFVFIHMPIPWLLGPMIAMLISSRFVKSTFLWPSYLRDTGLLIVGYSIGLSFTKTALIQIIAKLPSMLFMTVLLIAFCAGIAFVVSKITGVDYPTVLTGSIPGGLSQMIIFAEEVKGIDITTVTFLQVARLLMIIFFVPLIIFSPLFEAEKLSLASAILEQNVPNLVDLFPSIIVYTIVSILFALIGKRLRLPTPFLLGPILATAILNISGYPGHLLPVSILDISQFMIGVYIGLLLKPEKLHHKSKIISLALISGIIMVCGSFFLSILLTHQYDITNATSLLSLAPGGMDQMGIMAQEVHADLSMVTGYQLFRLFFIYFAVPPMLKLFFKFALKRQTDNIKN